jgi:hypothetical protein
MHLMMSMQVFGLAAFRGRLRIGSRTQEKRLQLEVPTTPGARFPSDVLQFLSMKAPIEVITKHKRIADLTVSGRARSSSGVRMKFLHRKVSW